MTTKCYAIDCGVNVESIAKQLGITDKPADVDFCYGPGETIQKLELRLENSGVCADDGPVFEMFREAHSAGLAHFEETSI
jgi:hypothetical protein